MDKLCLHLRWALSDTPRYAMVGEFPSIHHNEIRDITASLLTEVCSNVAIEPQVQPFTGENLNFASANTDDGS